MAHLSFFPPTLCFMYEANLVDSVTNSSLVSSLLAVSSYTSFFLNYNSLFGCPLKDFPVYLDPLYCGVPNLVFFVKGHIYLYPFQTAEAFVPCIGFMVSATFGTLVPYACGGVYVYMYSPLIKLKCLLDSLGSLLCFLSGSEMARSDRFVVVHTTKCF